MDDVWWCYPAPDPSNGQQISGGQKMPKELENATDVEALVLGCPKRCWYLLYSSFFFFVMFTPFWNDPHWVSFLGCSGPLAPRALTTWNMKLSDDLLSWSSNIRAVRFQLGNLSIECIELWKNWNTWKIAGWAWLCPSCWSPRLRKRLCQSIGCGPKCCCPSHFFYFAAFHFAGVKFLNSLQMDNSFNHSTMLGKSYCAWRRLAAYSHTNWNWKLWEYMFFFAFRLNF